MESSLTNRREEEVKWKIMRGRVAGAGAQDGAEPQSCVVAADGQTVQGDKAVEKRIWNPSMIRIVDLSEVILSGVL